MAVRICPTCQKSTRIVSGATLTCQHCGSSLIAGSPVSPPPSEPSTLDPSCRKLAMGCLWIILIPVAILVLLVIFGPKNPTKSIEQIQREHLERKVRKDLQHEDAANQRAAQEALERIRQRSSSDH